MHTNHYVKPALFFTLLMFAITSIRGQYALNNLDMDGDLYSWYDLSLGLENNGIVRGAYERTSRYPFSNPFFEEDSWDINKVMYGGEVYDSVYLIYDIQNDYLLIRHPTEYQYFNNPIKLNHEQVKWFTLNDHFFRFYSEKIFSFRPGFYEELFIGENIDFLIKHVKNLETKDQTDLVFEKQETYLVKYQDEYSKLSGRGSFLRRFNDNKDLKKKLKKFIKNNGLRIREGHDSDILMLADFLEKELEK